MTEHRSLPTIPRGVDVFIALCERASPREMWALISTNGQILPLGLSEPGTTHHELSVDALMLLGSAEKWKDHGDTWLLAHSHPFGRAVLSAHDRIAMARGGCPAWPFPLLVVGLSPQPTLACYKWHASFRKFLRVDCRPSRTARNEAITEPGRETHLA